MVSSVRMAATTSKRQKKRPLAPTKSSSIKLVHGWWSYLSLANRLFILTLLATSTVMALIAVVIAFQVRHMAEDTVEREFNSALNNAAQSFQLVFDNARQQAEALLPVLEHELGGIPYPTGDSVSGIDGTEIPVLMVDGGALNADVSALLRLQSNTGAEAAVIVKADTQWVRIATLLRDRDGQLMLDSVVKPDDLLARTLDSGEAYTGLVQRNDLWYAMSILPLKDADGLVYGGFSIRISVDSQIAGLLAAMARVELARYGRLGVAEVDASGQWHPAVAGGDLSAGLSGAQRAQVADIVQDRPSGFGRLAAASAAPEMLIAWVHLPGWNWTLFGAGERAAFLSDSKRLIVLQLGMMAAGIALIALLVWAVVRKTLRPLGLVVSTLERVGRGDLTAELPIVPSNSQNEVHRLLGHVAATQRGLERTTDSVRRGVAEIRISISQIAAGNTELSSQTEQQAASLQETAASMEQLAVTVRQNTEQARQAASMAAEFSQVAQRGEVAVEGVVRTMQDIASSSAQISDIVEVIDGIAFQTNILALNAAVEAARAGEEGRGFAVVAGEVRALAQRSARAAADIKGLIDNSMAKVDGGVREVGGAGQTMAELLGAVEQMTRVMQDIAHASEEQAAGITEVNQAVAQMDAATQQNAALVQQAGAAADSLNQQAGQLSAAVAVFVSKKRPETNVSGAAQSLLDRVLPVAAT